MKNKEFKQMVKDHIIKQQFILIYGQDKLHRYYRTVEKPYKYYISKWSVMHGKIMHDNYEINEHIKYVPGKIVHDNYEINESTFNTAYNEFLVQVKCVQGDPELAKQEINDSRIKQLGYPEENIPMEQRKYWKIRAGALEFMLKYKEQDKTGTAHS